jgi:quercetin dioxygenase-like cupin family protein
MSAALPLPDAQPHERIGLEKLGDFCVCVDGIFIKQMRLQCGWFVVQHAHAFAHHSMLAHGSLRVWLDDKQVGDFHAPTAILIRPGVQHRMQALADETVLYCIHNLHGREDVEILAEH